MILRFYKKNFVSQSHTIVTSKFPVILEKHIIKRTGHVVRTQFPEHEKPHFVKKSMPKIVIAQRNNLFVLGNKKKLSSLAYKKPRSFLKRETKVFQSSEN